MYKTSFTLYQHATSLSPLFSRSADRAEIYVIIKNLKNKSTKDTKVSALKIAAEESNFINAPVATVS